LYWLHASDEPNVCSISFTSDGNLVTLERDNDKIGTREIDFGLTWHYRCVSGLAAVLTVALTACAVWSWSKVRISWFHGYVLFLCTACALFVIGSFWAGIWIEPWGEDTIPISPSVLFHPLLWAGSIFILWLALG
jgi:hypothetical protein